MDSNICEINLNDYTFKIIVRQISHKNNMNRKNKQKVSLLKNVTEHTNPNVRTGRQSISELPYMFEGD